MKPDAEDLRFRPASTAVSGAFRVVPIAQVHESPLNPRKHFDLAALRELADSIRAKGIITPLLARPRKDGGFELAAGHRRLRASLDAGLTELPLVIREMTDEDFIEVLTVENLQREDVHPLEEADGYRVLIDTWRAGRAQKGDGGGLREDVEKVAARVGKSVSYVYQRLKLQDLSSVGRQRFLAGEMTAGHAVQIARLPENRQKEALAACFREEWDGRGSTRRAVVSVRELAQWIEQHVHCNLSSVSFKKADPDLIPAAGTCTTCPKRAGNDPELFGDVQKDRCTDPTCFQAKVSAFIEKSVASGSLQLSSNYGKAGKDVLCRDRFVVITGKGASSVVDQCRSSVPGIYVEGYEKGQAVIVCASQDCPTHHRGLVTGSDNGYAARERENKKKAKAENDLRRAILLEIRGQVSDQIPRELLIMVARVLWERIYDETRKRIAPLLGWEPSRVAPAEAIQALSEADLARLLVTLAVSGDLSVSPWDQQAKPTLLLEVANLYGVDVPKLRAAAAKKKVGAEKRGRVQTSAKAKKAGRKPAA